MIKIENNSIKVKLIIVYVLIVFIPLLIIVKKENNATKDYFIEKRKKEILNETIVIANRIGELGYLDKDEVNNYMESTSSNYSYRSLVLNDKAQVISDSNNTNVGKIIISKETMKAISNINYSVYREKEKAIYTAATITHKNSKEAKGVLLLVSNIDELYLMITRINKNFTKLLILMVIFNLFFLVVLYKWLLYPLKKVLPILTKMSKGDFTNRITLKKDNEFKIIIEAFNEMAEKIEKIELSRDEFVSNVSHEIKTPLSSIKVLSESLLIQKSVKKETYDEFLEDIVSETNRLTSIVNDLLDLVKLDQGETILNIEKDNLNILIKSIVKRFKGISNKKEIQLNYASKESVECEYDKLQMDLAITNIISNAIKYTPQKGSINIRLEKIDEEIVIEIEDTGCGIEEKDYDNIFKRFYRVDKMRGRGTGGTGIGLSISYAAIILHSGEITLDSKLGLGTTFRITIPKVYKRGDIQ